MAWVSKEKKAKVLAALKLTVPASWRWSLAVRHHSTLVLTIYSAPVDLMAIVTARKLSEERRASARERGYTDLNNHWWREVVAEDSLPLFGVIFAALNVDNHDRSDSQSDYHDVGHYVEVNVGRYDRRFIVDGAGVTA